MPDTFEAIAVIAFALLPGALFVWAVERITGGWGVKHVDRLLRFIAVSISLHVLASPISYWAYFRFFQGDALRNGEGIPLELYELALAYLLVPYLVGTIVGRGLLGDQQWARWVFGVQGQPPRAWDKVWSTAPTGYVRMLLKTDPPTWVAGLLGRQGDRNSYMATYPEEHQDIYLVRRLKCDEETGQLDYEAGSKPTQLEGSLLVRWDEVLLLEVVEPRQS